MHREASYKFASSCFLADESGPAQTHCDLLCCQHPHIKGSLSASVALEQLKVIRVLLGASLARAPIVFKRCDQMRGSCNSFFKHINGHMQEPEIPGFWST